MRLKTKIKKAIRRNERKMTTKKAKKAIGTIAFAIFTILSIQALISVANSSKVITIDNWDARIAAESPTVLPEAQDEAKDGEPGTTEGVVGTPSEVVKMIEETFPEEKEIAVAVVKSESGLDPKRHSETDRMADGRAFSIGLMQINLTAHKLGGKDCYKAFSGRDYKAKVVNEELYAECVKLAEDPEVNIATGKGIYERSGKNFGKWGGFTSNSYLKHL